MKTVFMACKRQFLYIFFLFLPLCLFAQAGNREMVAVIPFWGPNETTQVQFAEEVLNGINRLGGYRSTLIDMTDIPEDVPEGGYEPNVCPSPSLTKGIPFAMTGEVSEDFDTGGWALRVYLWRMEGTRLIYSDRLVAFDRETCRLILPGLLDWIFSFLKEDDAPFSLVAAGAAGEGGGVSQVRYYAPEEPNHWLYIGLRGGVALKALGDPGTALYKPNPQIGAMFEDKDGPYTYWSTMNIANAAITFAWMFPDNALFASPFGLQVEGLFDWDSEEDYMSIAVAGILRTHLYRKGTAAITLLPGLYWAPEKMLNNENFERNIVLEGKRRPGGAGVTVGINAGNKFGPGYLYLELRYMGDWFFRTAKGGEGFIRHLAGLCIGYEFGIIEKKK
jgi:hypothetical protein